MGNIWFSSDQHFGHANILRFRPTPWATDLDAHNSYLVNRWNERVQPDDEVWVLGDFIMGPKDDTLPHFVNRLMGRIRLVPGNHDGPWSGNKPGYAERWAQRYQDLGIELLPEHTTFTFDTGQTVNVSHFPYDADDRHADKHAEHLSVDDGRWLLHGHVHDAWKQKGRQINVGVDVWDGAPVAAADLAAICAA
jgi:calcineurin-like phosphoesterase family protein